MKTSLNINGECTWLAFCLNYFPIPIPMLHVNILACTILKFIKELSYGKDPVHLPCTKIKALILSHLKNCHRWSRKNTFWKYSRFQKTPLVQQYLKSCSVTFAYITLKLIFAFYVANNERVYHNRCSFSTETFTVYPICSIFVMNSSYLLYLKIKSSL